MLNSSVFHRGKVSGFLCDGVSACKRESPIMISAVLLAVFKEPVAFVDDSRPLFLCESLVSELMPSLLKSEELNRSLAVQNDFPR